MPQHRTLLHSDASLLVERVVQHGSATDWSPSYHAASDRLVLPQSGATEFRLGSQALLADSLTLLALPAGRPYQMKPCGRAPRASVVVSARGALPVPLNGAGRGGADSGAPTGPVRPGSGAPGLQAWLLHPRDVWRLRRLWRPAAGPCEEAGAGSAMPNPQGGDALHLHLHLQALRLQRTVRQARPIGDEPRVQAARNFMAQRLQQRPADRWSSHDLGDALGCSPFHLAHLFRRYTGTSLHAYARQLRVVEAMGRIEGGERDLAGLAHELGYSSQSHMGQAFQSFLGVTPGQFGQSCRRAASA